MTRITLLDSILSSKTKKLFSNRDFKTLYGGHAISNIGDELYFIAAVWLVFELTGSTFYTGIAGALARVPGVFGFVFGPLIDKYDLKQVLTLSEISQALLVGVLFATSLFRTPSVWELFIIIALISTMKQISDPSQTTAIPRIVADQNLVRANSVMETVDQAIGAAARSGAGVIIAFIGASAAFGLNMITFIISTLLFLSTKIPSVNDSDPGDDATEESESDDGRLSSISYRIKKSAQGASIVKRTRLIHIVAGVCLANVFTGMATAVLPAFADMIGSGGTFGGSGTYGMLMGSITAGMMTGALISSRFETTPLGKITSRGFILASICWLGAVSFNRFPIVLALFAISYVPIGIYNVQILAAVQSGVDKAILGRVTTTISSLMAAIGPAGLVIGGYLGDLVGSRVVVGASAIGFALIAVYWLVVSDLRKFPSVESIEPGSIASETVQN